MYVKPSAGVSLFWTKRSRSTTIRRVSFVILTTNSRDGKGTRLTRKKFGKIT